MPFLWDGTTVYELPRRDGELGRAIATEINEFDQVAGVSFTGFFGPPTGSQAFFWDGVLQELGTFGGENSSVSEMNDWGQVVGSAQTADGSSHAFLWDGVLRDLGTLGGGLSAPTTSTI